MIYFRIALKCVKSDGSEFHIPDLSVKDSALYTKEDIQETVFAFVREQHYLLESLAIKMIDGEIPRRAKALYELLPITGQWPQYQVHFDVNNSRTKVARFMSLNELETRVNSLTTNDVVTIRFGLCRQDDYGAIKPVSELDRIKIGELLERLHLPAAVFSEWK